MMDHSQITKIIVANAVKKGLCDIKKDSKRGVRYLVDLGADFSKTRVQQEFFAHVQNLLQNSKSVYYRLVSKIVHEVDLKTLETVGINIGYMSWTYGARKIREHESRHSYNVPWTVFLDCNGHSDPCVDYRSLISDGMTMGIYTYLVAVGDDTDNLTSLIELFSSYNECAFIIFSKAESTSRALSSADALPHNVMISVGHAQPGRQTHMAALAQKKRLHAVHFVYDDTNVSEILSGRLLRQYHTSGYAFAFFIAHESCSAVVRERVCAFVNACRTQQTYPVFAFDLLSDVDYMDKVISVESCMAEIRYDGAVIARCKKAADINAVTSSLEQILLKTMPRAGYTNS